MTPVDEQLMEKLKFITETGSKLGTKIDQIILQFEYSKGKNDTFKGLTFQQTHICMKLYQRGASGLKGLAQAAGVTPPSMSVMVEKLVRKGTVRRVTDPDDRRKVKIELTEEAVDAMKDMHAEVMRFIIGIAEKIGNEAVEHWFLTMKELRRVFDEEDAMEVGV